NIRKVLRNFAPARCSLAVLDYKADPIRYNNKATYNGTYNHGSS
ncbi:phage tail protein, partial [Mannheimia haemolytica]